MGRIKFSEKRQLEITSKIQEYMNRELDMEIGRFDAEFFLEFISEEIGKYFYNEGLKDALAIVEERLEGIADAIYEKEIPE